MIVHVVLFRPRAGLSPEQRARLSEVFLTAIGTIPSIRRARVGRRVTHGRGYETLMTADYSHAAILEFDDMAALGAYLNHPAHEQLGALFFETFEQALMYDYELRDGADGVASLTDSPAS